MWCADCETITDYIFDETTFWVFVPTVDSFGKVIVLCGSENLIGQQESSHCISTTIADKQQLDKFLLGLSGSFNAQELAATKITTTNGRVHPSVDDIGRLIPADVFINRFKAQWLVTAIETENFETWYQPIVTYQGEDRDALTYAHEGLFRLRDSDNTIMSPALAFSIAESADLLFSLDLVARRSAVECAAKGRLKGKIFINFNPSSVYDPSYCLRSTASAISELGIDAQDIVFEITETHKVRNLNHLKGILAFYRNAGFKVALDDIGSGWSGLNLLNDVRPDYVKIDIDLVRDIHIDSYKQNIVKSLIDIAKNNSIKIISEGIETAEEAQWLHAAGTDFMQGFYFGKPMQVGNVLNEQDSEEVTRSLRPLDEAAKNV